MMDESIFSRLVMERVLAKLKGYQTYRIPVGVSNRHIHVTAEHLEVLFGKSYKLTKKSELGQPGQFAANETVTVRGPKGEFKNVRILGPVRKQSQLEISKTDSFRIGVKPPIRESGHLDNSPGVDVIGPKGSIHLPCGTIVALRHIHMTLAEAKSFGVHDREIVNVEIFGSRRGIMGDVLIRVSDASALEMHVDVDEANACALGNKDYVMIHRG